MDNPDDDPQQEQTSQDKISQSEQSGFGWMDLIPFLLFVLAVAFFFGAIHVTYSTQGTNSGLGTQQNMPEITIDPVSFEDLFNPDQTVTIGGEAMEGPVIVNFFASWCQPCKVEHPLLMQLSKRTDLPLIGVAFSDDENDAKAFLEDLGNPFTRVGMDTKAEVGVQFAVDGIPATFLVNEKGTIVWRHKGPLKEINSLLTAINELGSE